MRRWLILIVAGICLAGLATARDLDPSRRVLLVDVKGAIGVATDMQIAAALEQAQAEDAALVILRIDTPGGLVSSTRAIIQNILRSEVPVAVYVAPTGARAASAGTYIAYAAHFAAMAPATHLGAATPIALGGFPSSPGPSEQPRRESPDRRDESSQPGGPSSAERKAINDAVAYIRSLAQLRGRNADWAEKAVREAATLTAEDAVRERVVDVLAADVEDLMAKLHGRTVSIRGDERKLAIEGLPVELVDANWRMRLLATIADPNIAVILMMIGIYGILFEFWSPGALVPGVVGGISLLLGLTALSVLPVNYGGLALILLGLALMVGEVFAPGFGVLGVAGIAAVVVGAIFLFDPAAADIDYAVAWPVIIGIGLTSAAALAVVVRIALRARRYPTITGAEQMIGIEGTVVDWNGIDGTVRAHGEVWSGRGPQSLASGQRVRIVGRDGLTLVVEPT